MLFQEITAEEFAAIRAREAYGDGLKEGFENGEKAGANQREREIAANLKKSGITLDVIAANTGLTLEEIEEL